MVAVRLEPMTEEQYVDYRATAEIDYGRNIAASGAMPESEARAKAAEDFARLVPDGVGSEGHRFFSAYDVAATPEPSGDARGSESAGTGASSRSGSTCSGPTAAPRRSTSRWASR